MSQVTLSVPEPIAAKDEASKVGRRSKKLKEDIGLWIQFLEGNKPDGILNACLELGYA